MHPSDMILEQSNDDDESYIDQRPRIGIDLIGGADDQEHISLIEDDYIIVDPVTERYRASQSNQRNRRSFFEENLMATEQSPLTARNQYLRSKDSLMSGEQNNKSNSMQPHYQESKSDPALGIHISQPMLGAGLTDCSEDEEEDNLKDYESGSGDKSERSLKSSNSDSHFNVDNSIIETEDN